MTEAARQVYLYLDDLAGLIVPNSAFANDEEKKEFIRVLEERIAQAKKDAPEEKEEA